jgi:hypothetical protein
MLSVGSRRYLSIVGIALAASGCAARPAASASGSSEASPNRVEGSGQPGYGSDVRAAAPATEAELQGESKEKVQADDARASSVPMAPAQAPSPRPAESSKDGAFATPPRDAIRAVAELEQAEAALLRTLAAAGGVSAAAGRCSDVCKAIDSMRRAADGVCRLDAGRCPDARARLARAEDRAKASCATCGTSP